MFVPKKSCIFVTVKGKGDVKGKAPGLHLSTLSGATKKFCSMAKVVNNSRICKATIFVGLNDKESKLQEEAAKYLQRAAIPFINRVKDFLNQETVALQLEEIESELV